MPIATELPLVVYGLKHDPLKHQPTRHFIIFNCIVPGALVPMKNSVYVVFKDETTGYELRDHWARRARDEGDEVYSLADALQRTKGLHWLYITSAGLVARGEQEMVAEAPNIMSKMRKSLEDVFGKIQFEEVAARELWVPSINAITLAKSIGTLLPA